MSVSLRQTGQDAVPLTGAGARMRDLLLNTAVGLMQSGRSPSVSDAAEAAGVSRATAYRYFPSQSALVEAVVNHALGPILKWDSALEDPEARVNDLQVSSGARISEFEATFKAALALSLVQERSNHDLPGPKFRRGHRIELLRKALEPLDGRLSEVELTRLTKALSLTFGIEVILVLKDIWQCDAEDIQEVVTWAARALVRSALMEAEGQPAAC